MRSFVTTLLISLPSLVLAQATFKCGWDTYKTAMVVHEYTYRFEIRDSVHLYLADSTKSWVAQDSQVVMNVTFPFQGYKTIFKKAEYYNPKRKMAKMEEWKDNLTTTIKEFKYDDKNRLIQETEDNKATGKTYKKVYDYSTDKNGDQVIKSVSYENGAVEFYTNSYIDKDNRKTKEVRLNNNNKDILNTENFYYTTDGRLKQRTVYFHEWKVNKKFDEPGGEDPAKCFRAIPLTVNEKPALNTKVAFLRKLLKQNQAMLLDPDCRNYIYRFYNKDCEALVRTTKVNNITEVVFRFRERAH